MLKSTLKSAVLTLGAALLPGLAMATNETGPEALAASFMTQFYDVPVEQVTVTISNRTERSATALASVPDGHACAMDMALAPDGVNAQFGWLVSSMKCDQ